MNFPPKWPSVVLCAFAFVSTGCASHEPQRAVYKSSTIPQSRQANTPRPDIRADMPIGAMAADVAVQQVGVPYRWGGNTPRGFDCSGLVHYSYAQVGIDLPRTTQDQRRAMRRVDIEAAEPGDLLFFKTWRKGWHVALYLGDNEFVHAPSTGKTVTVRSLDNPYYRDHLVDVRQVVVR